MYFRWTFHKSCTSDGHFHKSCTSDGLFINHVLQMDISINNFYTCTSDGHIHKSCTSDGHLHKQFLYMYFRWAYS